MTREIPLTQGKVALVSDEDYEKVSAYRWYANSYGRRWYAVHSDGKAPNQRAILLHRYVTMAPPDMQVDHVNGDGLDCRRENLRFCTQAENIRNQQKRSGTISPYKGVTRVGVKWRVKITLAGKTICVGTFASEEAAARAYDAAARQHHGEFARLNFPEPKSAPIK